MMAPRHSPRATSAITKAFLAVSISFLGLQLPAGAQVDASSPVAQIDALNGTFGKHDGKRASHAKGFCAQGDFTPAAKLDTFVKSPLFSQKKMDATVRFSIGGGNPGASDKSRSVRGLGARISGGGETYDLVLISEPVFFASTPESFVSFLQARVPDPATKKPDPAKVAAHNAKYPEAKNQPALLASHPAPYSYATTPYYSTNAFIFKAANKTEQHARIVVEPAAGTRYLTEQEEQSLPDLFLENELNSRLAAATAEFTIYAQLPAPGDSLTDSSQPWQGSQRVALGKLRVLNVAPQSTCDGLVFMPVTLPSGITPSDDSILKARAPAYAVSLGRRSN
ncbi:catalase [Pseudoduganella sp. FT55W]|uniref:Catalase-related peroxidase n=1 Tax=Duganella rivi TaxID=2666083 RepID=A0A7X4GQY9_9BURK|nr:catalase family peroxidase [Duganella rivi]MYM67486.1 catalase [Duganella rivi]